ncbi:MAG: cyclic nucleotide-binding domain-containing protein [Clostridia bacterium]|nr:cyclic nucleotide-binding domain-containing protein [Clostridia bacterium]
MKIIQDKALLQSYLEKYNIGSYFDTENLNFQLIKYDKGNMLTMTQTKLKYFLFVVAGKFKIYGINEDGSIFSVAREDKFTFLGDIEFAGGKCSEFDTEALTDVICVALSYDDYAEIFHRDVKFLNFILKKMSDSMERNSAIELPSQSIENKLINYLTIIEPSHEINGIEKTLTQLRCSRRQLQRVISKMCTEGKLIKTGKGRYVLADDNT